MTGTINISGRHITGGDLTIKNGRVVVDGVDCTPEGKEITISVQGDVQMIKVDACTKIEVSGSVATLNTMSGEVHCGDVSGSVKTMSGDVHCGDVGGSVNTMSGDITRN
jgi:hypothetical protein